MKFYIASRFAKKEEVKRMHKILEEKGHSITTDWTVEQSLRPYELNSEITRVRAIKNLEGVRDADIFILITDKEGTDMYAELGIAISSLLDNNKPKIYVIGEYKNQSTFFFHPLISRKDTFEDVIKDLV